jgi:hypothetical protein
MKVKLAQALLRRKELQGKVDALRHINESVTYEVVARRQNVADGIDDVVAKVPKLTASEVTKEYDWHARQLRLIDAAIQQANWTTDIDVETSTMDDFTV